MDSRAPGLNGRQRSAADVVRAAAASERRVTCDVSATLAVLPGEARLVHQHLAELLANAILEGGNDD